MTDGVSLRAVIDDDLPIFFEQQQDPVARHMAGFTSKDASDRDAFDAHWAKIRIDDTVTAMTIVLDGRVAGNIGSFALGGKPHVTYWIGREHWGKGLATKALSMFLGIITARPLHASAAGDNIASIRVLERCGFAITGSEKAFANARGEEIEEVMLTLE
ncbi:MAG: GNAT family N-acetyltransferase [Actinomycetota bacterium]